MESPNKLLGMASSASYSGEAALYKPIGSSKK
jgi:hypothetical protein